MITLITGLPGAGKTLNTLELVESECPGRKIYYSGIEELTLPWTLIDRDEINNWQDYEDGTVFVIDEIQKTWVANTKAPTSPPAIMAMDTHRHRGFDFYLITQDPLLVDHRLRKFVGRHIHYERAMGVNMSRRLTFQKCANKPDDHFARKEAEITTKRFNKKYFNKYKSATIHTVKKRVSWKVYAAVIAPFVLAALVYRFVTGIGDDHVETFDSSFGGVSDILPSVGSSQYEVLTTEQYIENHIPRIKDVPHSAPIYDELTVVKTYPRPQCIHRLQLRSCKCYTQQATPMDIGKDRCLDIVRNGWFNPYYDEESERERDREQAIARASLSEDKEIQPSNPTIIYIGDDSVSRINNRTF